MRKKERSGAGVAAPIVLLGVLFENVTLAEAVIRIEQLVASGRSHYLATANVDFLVQSLRDVELHRILMDAHMVLCDGMPLVWASRLLGNGLPERVAGSDVVPWLIELAARKGYRIFFLGGAEEVAAAAVRRVEEQNPGLIAGYYSPRHCSLLEMDHEEIRGRIQEFKPDLLFVCFGCPKQEKWIAMNYRSLGVPVSIGVGGTIDFLAGRTRRAPVWMRRVGAEWVFRLLQEPLRLFRRYVRDLFIFSGAILGQWWSMQWRRRPGVQLRGPLQFKAGKWRRLRLPERLDKTVVGREGLICEEALANSRQCLLDLSGVKFVDSTGMGLLVRLQKQARVAHRKLILFTPSEPVQRALELMHLEEFFNVARDAAEAKRLIVRQERPVVVQPNYFPSKPSVFWQGEITACNVEHVWRSTQSYISARARKHEQLLVDMSALSFIDSSGVGLMMRAKRSALQQGFDLIFTGIQPTVREVLRLAKVEAFLLRA